MKAPSLPTSAIQCDDADDSLAVDAAWFESAFDVAFGGSTSEVCRRFSEDLKAALALQNADDQYRLSPAEILPLVEAIQWRLAVASEWAVRLERAEDRAAK